MRYDIHVINIVLAILLLEPAQSKAPIQRSKLDASLNALMQGQVIAGDVTSGYADDGVVASLPSRPITSQDVSAANQIQPLHITKPSVTRSGKVNIDILVNKEDMEDLFKYLKEVSDFDGDGAGGVLSGAIGIKYLALLNEIDFVHSVNTVFRKARLGSVLGEGHKAIYTDVVRSTYDLTGKGVVIGAISGEFDCLGGAQDGIDSGDIPPDVIVLEDYNDTFCVDEGRALIEVMYDIAPGAQYMFHTVGFGQATFAQAIRNLAAAGCQIIVDDVGILTEPSLQPGVIAQAITEVEHESNVAYFYAQGNDGHSPGGSWEEHDGFKPSGVFFEDSSWEFHNFGTDEEVVVDLPVRFSGESGDFILTWDEPHFSATGTHGATTDIDALLYDADGEFLFGSGFPNIDADPIDFLNAFSDEFFETDLTLRLILVNQTGDELPSFLKLTAIGDLQFANGSQLYSTSWGHTTGPDGAGVGCSNFDQTPRFLETKTAIVANYSSRGGTPMFFDAQGNRLTNPQQFDQPKFVGPDGVETTFFGIQIGSAFRFNGTSASAPHAAALAALVLEANPDLTPQEVYQVLSETATDMDDPETTQRFDKGYDRVTGTGFLNGKKAVEKALKTKGAVLDKAFTKKGKKNKKRFGKGAHKRGKARKVLEEGSR